MPDRAPSACGPRRTASPPSTTSATARNSDDPPRCSRRGRCAPSPTASSPCCCRPICWRSGWATSKSGSSAPPAVRLGAGDARGGALGHRFSIRRLLLGTRSSWRRRGWPRGPLFPLAAAPGGVRRHAQPEHGDGERFSAARPNACSPRRRRRMRARRCSPLQASPARCSAPSGGARRGVAGMACRARRLADARGFAGDVRALRRGRRRVWAWYLRLRRARRRNETRCATRPVAAASCGGLPACSAWTRSRAA